MTKKLKEVIDENKENLPLSLQSMEFRKSKVGRGKVSKLMKSSFYQTDVVEVGINFYKDILRLI